MLWEHQTSNTSGITFPQKPRIPTPNVIYSCVLTVSTTWSGHYAPHISVLKSDPNIPAEKRTLVALRSDWTGNIYIIFHREPKINGLRGDNPLWHFDASITPRALLDRELSTKPTAPVPNESDSIHPQPVASPESLQSQQQIAAHSSPGFHRNDTTMSKPCNKSCYERIHLWMILVGLWFFTIFAWKKRTI